MSEVTNCIIRHWSCHHKYNPQLPTTGGRKRHINKGEPFSKWSENLIPLALSLSLLCTPLYSLPSIAHHCSPSSNPLLLLSFPIQIERDDLLKRKCGTCAGWRCVTHRNKKGEGKKEQADDKSGGRKRFLKANFRSREVVPLSGRALMSQKWQYTYMESLLLLCDRDQ